MTLLMPSSCSGILPESNRTPSTPPIQISPAMNATPLATVTEKPTATLNEQESLPNILPTSTSADTPTPLIIPTRTWIPIPTLDQQGKQQIIEKYFTEIRDCEIPCWWKITPGKTTWQEARRILSPLGIEEGPFTKTRLPKYYYTFQQPTELSPLGFELVVWLDGNQVIAVQTNSRWIKSGLDTSLAGLLKVFGQPDQIWIQALPESPNRETKYDLELFYPDQGVLIHNEGWALLTETSVILCPQKQGKNYYPPFILLFSRSDYKDYEKLTSDLYGDRTAGISTLIFRRLSDLTDGFDEEEFFKDFSDPQSEACFGISIEKLNR